MNYLFKKGFTMVQVYCFTAVVSVVIAIEIILISGCPVIFMKKPWSAQQARTPRQGSNQYNSVLCFFT
jgi:hypothetical protein